MLSISDTDYPSNASYMIADRTGWYLLIFDHHQQPKVKRIDKRYHYCQQDLVER